MNVVFGLCVGFALAIALIFLRPELIRNWSDRIVAVLLFATVAVGASGLIAFLFRRVLLRAVGLRADAALQQVVGPGRRLVHALSAKDQPAGRF